MERQRRLFMLDGMRGLAALAVVLYHFQADYPLPVRLFDGKLAVDFFFCLSGFVLARAHGEQLRTGSLTWRDFALLRWIRVWPMLALGTVVGAACLPWQGLASTPPPTAAVPTALLSFLALPFPGPDRVYWINGTFWSLLAELVVNLAYGILAAGRQQPPFRRALLLCGGIFVAASFWHGATDLTGPALRNMLQSWCRAGSSFLLGVLVHRWSGRPRALPRPTSVLPPVLLLGMLAASRTDGVGNLLFDLLCCFVIFPMLIAVAARARPSRLDRSWALLGDASFPLYAIHSPLIFVIVAATRDWSGPAKGMAIGVTMLVLFLLSIWIARHVEGPARAVLRRALLPRRASRTGGAGP